jgi:flagellar motor switch protein FliM
MAEAGIIRRKVAAGRAVTAEGGPGADRGWRIGLARAARDLLKVALDVRALTVERRSLAELAELVPERALIAVLEGPAEGLGAIIISQTILSGFIEAQTIGRIRNQETPARKPTRTDAAMVVGVIDAALSGLEQALAEEADLVWAGGFRYASFLDDPRPLTLLLEDAPLRLLRVEVSLAGGLREGEILLALPAEGRGQRPDAGVDPLAAHDHGPVFSDALAERINGAQSRVEAVLARLTMPLAQVMALAEGMVLPLPQAALDRISLEGLDGRHVGIGKLGQNRGMRAVRLIDASSLTEPAGHRIEEGKPGFGSGGLAPYARPSTEASQDFPAQHFPAPEAEDLSSFLATGTD